MIFALALFRLSLLTVCAGQPTINVVSRVARFETMAKTNGWMMGADAEPAELVHLTFWIKQQHTDKLQEVLKSVSNPQSSSYGHYLTKKQVESMTAPKSEDIVSVRDSLGKYGQNATLKGAVMDVQVPVHFAEALLGGRFIHFCRDGACALRNPAAELPATLFESCDIVTPLYDPLPPQYKKPQPIRLVRADPVGCCFSFGFGYDATMRPCCLSADLVQERGACREEERDGGMTAYREGACPSNPDEAAEAARGGGKATATTVGHAAEAALPDEAAEAAPLSPYPSISSIVGRIAALLVGLGLLSFVVVRWIGGGARRSEFHEVELPER